MEQRTIPALLAIRAASSPDALALIGSSYDGTIARTFAQLHQSALAIAGGLQRRGVKPGDRILWILDNRLSVEAFSIFHGVLIAGAVNVPLNTRLAAREIARIYERVRPAVVVQSDDQAVIPTAALPIVIGGGDWLELSGGCDAPVTPVAVDERSLASILFTSGTTGSPKGVLHTHGSSLAAGVGWADTFRLGPSDVLQSPFPVFTGAGLHFNGLSTLWAGAVNVVDGTDVGTSLDRVTRYGATVFVAVPSIYQYWLDSPLLGTADLKSLRILDYGGAAMPPEVIRRLRRAIPTAGLMQTYGLTEAGPGGLFLHEDYALEKLGSIGNRGAGPFTRFRVIDDVGNDVGPGGIGELVLRGPSVMMGYLEDAEATEAAFTSDGWLRTGDVVRIDPDGFVFHLDRLKDMIVRGGFNVASAEVEAVLVEHPAVLEAAVIGRPHQRLGEEIHAVVVLRTGEAVDPEELIVHARSVLADFKVPRTIEIRTEPLPRNASGKVLKTELRSVN